MVLVLYFGPIENKVLYVVLNRGTKWGENGYGKIARNRENHCGIGKAFKTELNSFLLK